MPAPPWFSFYPGDWLRSVSHLPLDVQGAHLRLLCHQWEHGGIPNDIATIARILAVGRGEATRIWAVLAERYHVADDGQARHLKLEDIRVKVEKFFRSQQHKAAAGAAARWGDKAKPAGTGPRNAGTNAPAMPAGIPAAVPLPQPDLKKESVRTSIPQKPGSYGASRSLALIQPRDRTAFWEGQIFNIPQKWAAKTLKASNGSLSEADVTAFAGWAHAKAERERIDLTTVNFLSWLDDELRQWRELQRSERTASAADARSLSHLEKVANLERER